jgi:DNA adenine methylase
VDCYIEPFFGSGAVLLGRPNPIGLEVANDLDSHIVNFFRSVKANPEAVAAAMIQPLFESDHHARHAELVSKREYLRSHLEGSITFYDAKLAGWWCWGKARMLSPFCNGKGPWKLKRGRGEPRRLVYDRKSGKPGIAREFFSTTNPSYETADEAIPLLKLLAERFRRVAVYCGEWHRCLGCLNKYEGKPRAVFLDPPYTAEAGRHRKQYACDDMKVGHDVREWALDHADDPGLRIALCGYDTEYEMPEGWECFGWENSGGYSDFYNNGCETGRENATRERIWFNANCRVTRTIASAWR